MVWEGFLFTFRTDPTIFNVGPVVVFALRHFNAKAVCPIKAHLTKESILVVSVLHACHKPSRGPWGQGFSQCHHRPIVKEPKESFVDRYGSASAAIRYSESVGANRTVPNQVALVN